jgi:hypothetical protein
MVDKLPKREVNVIGIGRARIPSAGILIPHLLGGHVRSQVEKPAVRVVSKCVGPTENRPRISGKGVRRWGQRDSVPERIILPTDLIAGEGV